MTTADETRTTVSRYFSAWTTKNVPAAFALLADGLVFVGPSASFKSADDGRIVEAYWLSR